ncbi:receptor like protein kinase S.2-like [Bidens hawaiensis]|uniref:receptor like protein kinase S.2-like n=1 Tax=Bidens hawaiensis TaxID=980011 RepID=UPI00404B08E0
MPSTIAKCDPLKIPLEDVVNATNNFHHDNIIGHGGFGTTYKGQLLRYGSLMKIAAQRFNHKHEEGNLEFIMEISMLSDLKHKNIISIIGYCDEKDEKILITTYEGAESLGQYLNNPNLTWTQRLRICLGVAHALSYLHCDEGRDYAVIHCNINSDTILLDDNREAKLSGFEISIKQLACYEDQVCLFKHAGTMGYVDPAIEKKGGVTHKSDIFSFSVVLFEILCGRKAFIQNEANESLAPLVKHHHEKGTLKDIIHPDLHWNQMSPQSLLMWSEIAYSCLSEDRADRPNLDNIVDELEKALEHQLLRENIGNNLEHLKLPLNDIISATDNFSDTCRTRVSRYYTWYRGELDCFDKETPPSIEGKNKGEPPKKHNTVLIRRVHPRDNEQGEELFYTEIEVLSSVKHHSIVSLLGFCIEGSEMIIVTENVSNKYLYEYLNNGNNKRILTWEKCLKICIDVAQSLNYLHFEIEDQRKVIIRFLRNYDIQLDENWGAKIDSFGLSVSMPPNKEDEALHLKMPAQTPYGSEYYLDPEYVKSGKLKRESGVYSFGVILFEILCGRLANDPIYLKESDKGLAPMARRSFSKGTTEEMIDPIIKEETNEHNFVLNRGPNKDSLHTFIEIAHQCVAETQDKRPTMKVVVKQLEKALFFQFIIIFSWLIGKDSLRIPLEDIKLATQKFHDDNCIGEGEFGKIYKGNLQDGDEFKTIVAKRLDTRLGQVKKQFLSEIQILREYKHENVIGLVGYCDEWKKKSLFMSMRLEEVFIGI